MQNHLPDYYAALGLHRRCSDDEIRTAYRLLAKQHHPDVSAGDPLSDQRAREINAAYEVLGNPERRRAYDRETRQRERGSETARSGRIDRNIQQDALLRLEEFLRGSTLEIRFTDPAGSGTQEVYTLTVPPGTAPGARFRLPRNEASGGGFVTIRVRARPDARFKVRGSDLRCDLRISPGRAEQGGFESIRALNGGSLRVQIPRGAARGEIVRLAGEGLPKLRGGRGDLLVRVTYRVPVGITRGVRG